ncbi:unnamed protein product [Closterium sp. NIES-54]
MGWRVCAASPAPPPPPSPTAAAAAEGGGCVGADGVVLGGGVSLVDSNTTAVPCSLTSLSSSSPTVNGLLLLLYIQPSRRRCPSEGGANTPLPLTLPCRAHAWASSPHGSTPRRKLVLGVHPTHNTPSPHQPCKRARHLLLHIIVAVADFGQMNLADGDRAQVESRKMQRLRQEVCRLLGGRDVLQHELPVPHHVLQPGIASLHVLEVARQP